MSPTKKGFTLIELLIIITILGLLSVTSIVTYSVQIKRGYDSIRKKDLKNLKIAFEHYYSDHSCYPESNILSNCGGDNLKPYQDVIPCDPQTKNPYTLDLDLDNCAQKFYIYTNLANVNDPQVICNGKYVVASPNVSAAELSSVCLGEFVCSNYYGCVAGTCTFITSAGKPACSPLFCDSSCQDSCGISSFALVPQDCHY